MGKLREYYNNLKKRYDEVTKSLKSQDLDYKKYREYSMESSLLERKMLNVVKNPMKSFSLDKMINVLSNTLGEDYTKAEKMEKQNKTELAYFNFFKYGGNDYLPKDKVIKDLNFKAKVKPDYKSLLKLSVTNKMKSLHGENVSQENIDKEVQKTLDSLVVPPTDYLKQENYFNNSDKIFDAIETEFDDKQVDKIIADTDKMKNFVEYTKEEALVKKHDDKIQKIKGNIKEKDIPLNSDGTKYSLKEIKENLDFINENITLDKPDFSIDGERAKFETTSNMGVRQIQCKTIENTMPDTLPYLYKTSDKYQWKPSTEKESVNALGKLTQVKPNLSKEWADNVTKLVHKIEDYGLIQQGSAFEEPYKMYAFRKLDNCRVNFEKALEENNTKDMVRYSADYKKSYEEVKELTQFVKDNFSNNDFIYPANLDVTRNANMPLEFRQNIQNTALLNSAFALTMYLKEQKLSVEEFVKDPVKTLQKTTVIDESLSPENLMKEKIDVTVKGQGTKNTTEKRELTTGEFLSYLRSSDFQGKVTGKAIQSTSPRIYEFLANSEKNDERFKQNIVFGEINYSSFMSRVSGYNMRALDIAGRDKMPALVEHICLMNDDNFDLIAAAEPTSDMINPVTNELEGGTFNSIEHILNDDIDYVKMLDKMKNIACDYKNACDNFKRFGTDVPTTDVLEGMQSAALKTLALRSKDKKAPGFSELEKFAKDPIKVANGWFKEKNLSAIQVLKNPRFSDDVKIKETADKMAKAGKFYGNLSSEYSKTAKEYAKRAEQFGKGAFNKKMSRQEIEDKKTALLSDLQDKFKKGEITEYYLSKRSEQIRNEKFNEKPPKMFKIDEFPSRKKYKPDYDKEILDDLSKDEIDELYKRDKERATNEKEEFLKRRVLEKNGFEKPQNIVPTEKKSVISEKVHVIEEDKSYDVDINEFFAKLEKDIAGNDKTKNNISEKIEVGNEKVTNKTIDVPE